MNNAKLCAIIVMMCVVVPVIVGYAYPTDQQESTSYEQDRMMNITNSMFNDTIPGIIQYDGLYNNMYYGDLFVPTNNSTLRSTSAGTWPILSWISNATIENTSGTYTKDTLLQAATTALGQDDIAESAYLCFWATGFHADSASSQVLMLNMNTGEMYLPNYEGRRFVTNETLSIVGNMTVTAYGIMKNLEGNPYYADLSKGSSWSYSAPSPAWVPVDAIWWNGYVNKAIVMILDISRHTAGASNTITIGDTSLTITVEDGMVTATTQTTGNEAASRSIGSFDNYPFLSIEIDADSDTVTVTGLVGMSSVTDSYSDKMGNSVTLPFETARFSQYLASYDGDSAGNARFYIASATVEYGTTNVLKDATLRPGGYYPDTYWGVSFNSGAVYGDSVTLTASDGTQYLLPVTDGLMDLSALEMGSVRFINTTLQWVPDSNGNATMYVNGVPIEKQITAITFNGTWNMAVYLTTFSAVESSSYVWDAGSFNLGETAFCVVGLMTAFAMFIVVSLYGRMNGGKTGLAMLVAGMCGAVYLVLLM